MKHFQPLRLIKSFSFFLKSQSQCTRWLLTLVVSLLVQQGMATRYYINANATGNGNGLTWTNAFTNINGLGNNLNPGDEVWIAKGTYMAIGGSGSSVIGSVGFQSILLKAGVKMYGGFAGGESSVSQRNPAFNEVILTRPSSSSFSVVTCDNANSNTLLDGVTVSGGMANPGIGTSSGNGGGLNTAGSSMVVNNVIFKNNTAAYFGGAVYISSGNPVFTNVTFNNNSSVNLNGGGMYMSGGTVSLTNATFTDNAATNGNGGAIYADGTTLNITNSTFTNNYAKVNGGAIFYQNAAEGATITKTVFTFNRAGVTAGSQGEAIASNTSALGGAIYMNYAACFADKVIFSANKVGGSGGAIFSTNTTSTTDVQRVPRFTNSVFWRNWCIGNDGVGGAIADEKASISLINNTFCQNETGRNTTGGAGLHVYGSNPTPTATVANCIFFSNLVAFSTRLSDIVKANAAIVNITYSSFNEVANYGSGSNNIGPVSNPFLSPNTPLGNDGAWYTNDDGLQLTFCGAALIDKGSNSAIPNGITKDVLDSTRIRDVELIDGGSSTNPIVDMGAYENRNNTSRSSITGSIGNAHAVPFPQESSSDIISNEVSPIAGSSYTWQQKTDGASSFVPATGTNTNLTYSIPNINTTTTYRRMVTNPDYCNVPFYSNEVIIKVVNPNGLINGKVISNGGVGVKGILIKVTRLVAIPGSPADYTYTDTTGDDGTYSVNPIYYGDPATGNVSASFRVEPIKQGHGFTISSIIKELSTNQPQLQNVNFTDTTTLSITGLTYQQCADCITSDMPTVTTGTKNCPIDSVTIYKENSYNTVSGIINNEHGRYAVTVTEPTQIKIEPRLTGHRFSPTFQLVTPTDNIEGIDFKDTTTHVISGTFTAGCAGYIGTAVLEFFDVLPKNPDSSVNSPCFRKRVTTNTTSGFYSIRLPARKYRVKVVSFTPSASAGVVADDVVTFINDKVPADSLTRNIATNDTTLNLVYTRPPQIKVIGLNNACSGATFALIPQNRIDSFRVYVYQGDPVYNCPLNDTTRIKIQTNVQQFDQVDTLSVALSDSGRWVKLKGGIPNITGDYLKNLSAYFSDRYSRVAPAYSRQVLVTGMKSDAATFTTVSPEIPLMVLHDPPGDASFSTFQQSHSSQNTMRFYTAASVGAEAWVEAKLGVQATVGIGIATDISAWGTIRGTLGVSSTVTPSNEAVITTTAITDYSTSSTPDFIGSSADVYVGAALNLKYAVGTEIALNNCAITSNRRLMMADSGFSTTYIYTEDNILNSVIPSLQQLAIDDTSAARKAKYLNQVKVWQQVIDNNTENKRRAAFVENKSFSGGTSNSYTTISSTSKTSTLEFSAEINASVAAELGFEIEGSGVSGGASVNFKVETGGSNSNTVTDETTMSYTLADNTPGDNFTVNIKKDPIYNSPVFDLVAGRASCPAEPGAQPRDEVFVTALNPVLQNVPANGNADFQIKIVNTSPSNESRSYKIAYDQGSNVNNETITIAGSPYTVPVSFGPIAYLDSAILTVSVHRSTSSSVYSYPGIRFIVTDACTGNVSKTVQVSANFVSPCSNITLSQPAEGWLLNASNNNILFVKATDYTLANLNSVELQYAAGNSNSWSSGPSFTAAQLANGLNWDISNLPSIVDGSVYNLRLRLACASGVTYSQKVSGIIDRKAPVLFGRPDPTDDNYVNGDIIAFTYNEKLSTNPAGLQATIRRLSNGQLIPATVSIYENKVLITPSTSLTGFAGDSIRVILAGVSDVNGNIKPLADTTRFTVGTTIVSNSNGAITLSITNPVVFKNGDSTINVMFNLPAARPFSQTYINYAFSGTARYGIDYTVSYTSPDNSTFANGATGSIKIVSGNQQAILKIKPLSDTGWSPDKTVIISVLDGGDYTLGATTTATGTITSEDGVSVYTFNGDGNWSNKDNWLNRKMPLSTLVAPKEIIISPVVMCRLNMPQTLKPGSKLTVKQNREFLIQGNLKLN